MRGERGQPLISVGTRAAALLNKLDKKSMANFEGESIDAEEVIDATAIAAIKNNASMITRAEMSLVASVEVLLQGLGEDLSRDGLLKTPLRVARAFLSATAGYRTPVDRILQGALFTESGPENGKKWLTEVGGGGGCGGMVVVRNIDLFPTCESCLLPFRVCCHMAYIPSKQRVVGLSKLPRVAEVYASRLQNPERLVDDVAEGLLEGFNPLGVAVVAECWHLRWPEGCGHSSVEPVEWVSRTVYSGRGTFRDSSSSLWDEFLAMLQLAGIKLELPELESAAVTCPLLSSPTSQKVSTNGLSNGLLKQKALNLEAMVQAVRSMLEALGEDPDREGLKQTPMCYVRWLLTSTQGSRGLYDVPHASSNGKLNGMQLQVEGEGRMRLALDLPFCSQCEHHLLPFSGVAHVGYLVAEGGNKTGDFHLDRFSLQRILKRFSCRLQVQERLTKQIAEAIISSSSFVRGVMVVLEASHICMISRGIKKVGSTTATMATLGEFAENAKAKVDFLRRISSQR